MNPCNEATADCCRTAAGDCDPQFCAKRIDAVRRHDLMQLAAITADTIRNHVRPHERRLFRQMVELHVSEG